MKILIAWLRAAVTRLEPKWRYAAETLAELLALLGWLLAGILGFLPWLLWRGICRALVRLKKEGAADGAAEKPDK